MVKNLPANAGDSGSIPLCKFCVCVHICVFIRMLLIVGREDSLEKEMATHSSILAWKSHGQRSQVGYSPWGHKRVKHDLATKQEQQPPRDDD